MLTTEEFIEKAIKIHKNNYDYKFVEYKKSIINVEILCKEHGIFKQTPHNHLKKKGCPDCSGNIRLTNEKFIKKSIEIYGNKYNYSKVNYVNNRTKIIIICSEHGEFLQTPNNHIKTCGCKNCVSEYLSVIQRKSIELLKEQCSEKHNNKYNYDNAVYKNNKTKIEIICPKHGIFKQTPDSHISGVGCPKCKCSKGEVEVIKFLEKNNTKYIHQYKFEDCRNKKELPFDFYVPKYNVCIEYDGKHHYKSIEYFGGEKGFENRKKLDKIKDEYCKTNNIKLIRIKWNENIELILNERLFIF